MRRPYRILVVGVGSIGQRHVRCFAKTGRSFLAICEPSDRLRREVAQLQEVQCDYASLDDALRAGPWDAAVVATPAPSHVQLAERIASQGIHLLIEKPLSLSLEGVEELARQTASKSLVAAVGYSHRSHPAMAGMRVALASGRFGKPLQLLVQCGQDFARYRPGYADVYFARRDQGGGAIQDAMTHMVNLGEWLVGPIHRLVVDAGHQSLPRVDVEDTVHVLARHGAVMASYALNLYQPANEVTITVVASRGICRAEYARHRWSSMTEPDSEWTHHPVDVPDGDTAFVAQANTFLDAIELGAPVPCSLEEGIQSLRVNLASLRSIQCNTWQDVTQSDMLTVDRS